MLEDRYIVFKKSDVARLDPKAQAQLDRLAAATNFVRELRGAEPIKAVVVEHDWPEYQKTINAIMFRVNAEKFGWKDFTCVALSGCVGVGLAIALGQFLAHHWK